MATNDSTLAARLAAEAFGTFLLSHLRHRGGRPLLFERHVESMREQ